MVPQTGSLLEQNARAAMARCGALGLRAIGMTMDGTTLDLGAVGGAGGAALPTAWIEEFRRRARDSSSHNGGLFSLGAGVSAGFVRVSDESGGGVLIAPVFESGYTPASAGAVLKALRIGADDEVALRQHSADIENFTSQLSHAYDTIDVLYTLGRSIARPQAPRDFLSALCARTRVVAGFSWVAVCFADDRAMPGVLRGETAMDGDMMADRSACRAALLAWAGTDGVRIHEGVSSLAAGGDGGACSQVVSIPLTLRGRGVGVLAAGGKSGADPMVSSYDTQLLEACAGFLATFIENVALYDDQKQLFMGTLQALTAAIDAKDRYTCGHSERVSVLSWQLAEAAGLSHEDAERVRIAGLVHDVGKIGVPESVLTKPGKLTETEFAFIKMHPEIGHRILTPVHLLADVLPGVLYHHERWDGRGYPHRLAGEAIPLQARIIAVADTFDAMSSDRSYRKRLSREQVLAEIIASRGTQLDPHLATLAAGLDLDLYDDLTARHARELTFSSARAAA